jgi:hypothetical protein
MEEMTEKFAEEMEEYLADRDISLDGVSDRYLKYTLQKMLKEEADPAEMAGICLLMYQRKNNEIEKLAKFLYMDANEGSSWNNIDHFVKVAWRMEAQSMLRKVALYEKFKESCK